MKAGGRERERGGGYQVPRGAATADTRSGIKPQSNHRLPRRRRGRWRRTTFERSRVADNNTGGTEEKSLPHRCGQFFYDFMIPLMLLSPSLSHLSLSLSRALITVL